VRALLDLMRGDEAAVRKLCTQCRYLLSEARVHLTILHPGHGEEELIKLVAAELAMLSQRKPKTLNPKSQTLHSKPCQVCLARRPTFRVLRRIRVVRRALRLPLP
jgi:hypothetical protein